MERIFSDEELNTILRTWYQRMGNKGETDIVETFVKAGFPECAEYAEWFNAQRLNRSIEVDKTRLDRAQKILSMCISGNVRNNPADLICPLCKSHYVAKIKCYDYLPSPSEEEKRQIALSFQTPYDEILQPLTDSNGNPYISDEKTYKCLACFHKW